MEEYQTARTTVRRIPQRGVYDRETIHRILDAGYVCHVGFVVEGQPFVIPMVYVRVGEHVYLHGSKASRMLRALAGGIPVCITVTILDGLVLARSAFHHSMNYRSVMVFGSGKAVEDPAEKNGIFRALADHLTPGRWEEIRGPNDVEMQQTLVVGIEIQEASAKIRTGPPKDDAEDYSLPIWAGVLPLTQVSGTPLPDSQLPNHIPVPSHVIHYEGPKPAIGI